MENKEQNNIQDWETEFWLKMELSFAKGGFLTTDYEGTWELDKKLVIEYIKSLLSSHQATIIKELESKKKIGTSTHGNCCTCSDCKNAHDECTCEFNQGISVAISVIKEKGI